MKNDNNINNSLSEIKKAIREEKLSSDDTSEFYLLSDIVKKGKLVDDKDVKILNKKYKENKSHKRHIKRGSYSKKILKNEKSMHLKKPSKKNISVENVINKEVKPIIQNWIKKNLREFVKKVVVEEFKVISKSAFKKKSVSK